MKLFMKNYVIESRMDMRARTRALKDPVIRDSYLYK